MKKRFFLALTLIVVMVISACIGCAKKDDESTTTGKDTPTKKEQPKVTLKMTHFKAEATDGINKLIEDFNKQYPNININVDLIEWGNYDTVMKTKFASNEVIDIICLKEGELLNKYARAGYLAELTDKPFMKNIQEVAIEASSTDGKNYAVPVDNSPIAVFYNKKIFKDNGFEVPKTYSELMKIAKQLKENGTAGFALGYKDEWPLSMFQSRVAVDVLYLQGQPEWGHNYIAGKTTFKETPEWKTVIAQCKDFYTYGNEDPLGVDYNKALDMFAAGDAAMIFQGLWILPEIEKRNPEFFNNDLGIFPYPATEDPNDVKLEATGDFVISAGSESEHPEEVMKFLEYMTTKEAADTWTTNIKTISAVKGSSLNFAPCLADIQSYFDKGQIYDAQPYLSQISGNWDGQITKYIIEYLIGQKTVDEVLEAEDKFMKRTLDN